jgi:ElaB/YqjD/DUF883 family membrane-anchored ribosome-binding protein
MTTPTSLRTGVATAQSYTEDALHTAENALERAGDTIRELRSGARDLAGKGLSSATEAAAAAQRRLNHYAATTTRYVADEPVKAALIAAAVGAVVAGLIIAARRNKDR